MSAQSMKSKNKTLQMGKEVHDADLWGVVVDLRQRVDNIEKEMRDLSKALKNTILDIRSLLSEMDNPFNFLRHLGIDKVIRKNFYEKSSGSEELAESSPKNSSKTFFKKTDDKPASSLPEFEGASEKTVVSRGVSYGRAAYGSLRKIVLRRLIIIGSYMILKFGGRNSKKLISRYILESIIDREIGIELMNIIEMLSYFLDESQQLYEQRVSLEDQTLIINLINVIDSDHEEFIEALLSLLFAKMNFISNFRVKDW